MSEFTVRLATATDRPVLERLWLLFRHELSGFDGKLPNPDGSFRSEWLESALSDADWAAYLMSVGDRPVGLAFVRSLSGPTRVLNSFFVVRGARRTGLGLQAVQQVIAHYPGPWEIAYQDVNQPAVQFWRRVATTIAGEAWTEEHRPIPNRPDLTPDTWISFVAGPA